MDNSNNSSNVKSPQATPLKPSILKHSTGKILQLGSKMGTYVLLSDCLPKPSFGLISFEINLLFVLSTHQFVPNLQAKGLNDILTCFHHEESLCVGHEGREDTAPSYEILIGGWLNTKTVIRKQGHIQAAVTKTGNPEAMITKTDFDKYWIAIQGDRLSVGKGEPGENKILSWRDVSPLPNISHVGFGSWHNPVLIKNIKILTPIITEDKLARKFDPMKVHDWFNQGKFADVVLLANDSLDASNPVYNEYLAHRAVLYAASKKFESIVRSEPKSKHSVRLCPIYQMPETLSSKILLQILKFIYTGKIVVDEIDSKNLLEWADYFEISNLVEICNLFNSDKNKFSGVEMKLSHLITDNNDQLTHQKGYKNHHDYSSLYQRSLFSDVFFVIKPTPESIVKTDKTIPVHKIILAMKSEPLGLMFTTGMKESMLQKIEFTENYTIFELMLRFIYTGNAQFLKSKSINDELIPLLRMADQFAVYPLRTALSEIFADLISLDTVCTFVNIATFYGLNNLRRKSLQYIETHFAEVVQSEAFLGLEASPLLEIIFGDDLIVPSEKAVYDALLSWGYGEMADGAAIEFDENEKQQRLSELKQLLSYVRYPLMDAQELQKILTTNQIVQETDYLREVVEEALQERLSQSNSSFSNLSNSLHSSGGLSSGLESPIFSPSSSLTSLPSYEVGALSGLSNSRRSNSVSKIGAFHTNARKTSAKHFLYSHDGDENGVLYWIATQGNTERWQNPHKSGKVIVTCSSPPSRWTSLSALVNRSFITNNFASGSPTHPAWWCIDLGAKNRLVCDYYSIQTDGSANVIGDWELQASNDLKQWATLRAHENSKATFSQGGGKNYSWPVDISQQTSPGYRYFRLIVTGATLNQNHKFSLSGVEFYGYLQQTATTPSSTSTPSPASATATTSTSTNNSPTIHQLSSSSSPK